MLLALRVSEGFTWLWGFQGLYIYIYIYIYIYLYLFILFYFFWFVCGFCFLFDCFVRDVRVWVKGSEKSTSKREHVQSGGWTASPARAARHRQCEALSPAIPRLATSSSKCHPLQVHTMRRLTSAQHGTKDGRSSLALIALRSRAFTITTSSIIVMRPKNPNMLSRLFVGSPGA